MLRRATSATPRPSRTALPAAATTSTPTRSSPRASSRARRATASASACSRTGAATPPAGRGPTSCSTGRRRRGAQVLVAGRNFGCGSSREHAVWALRDHGFRAVVGPVASPTSSAATRSRTACVPVPCRRAERTRALVAAPGARGHRSTWSRCAHAAGRHARRASRSSLRAPLPARRAWTSSQFLLAQEAAIAAYERRGTPDRTRKEHRPMTPAQIAVLQGDGIGPEVIEAALSVLGACVPGAGARRRSSAARPSTPRGDPLPPETLEICRRSDAVLLGAVGGPKWDGRRCGAEDGLLRLRQGLGLFANLRPARYMGLPTPLREALARQADILVVRDLAGGVYFGEPRGIAPTARPSTPGARPRPSRRERVAHVAFRAGRAGAAAASPRWTRPTCSSPRGCGARVVTEVAREYSGRRARAPLRRRRRFELLAAPHRFDVRAHREPVRRHPQRRGRASWRARSACCRRPRWATGPRSTSRCTARRPTLAGRGVANPTGAILSRGHDARARARPPRPRPRRRGRRHGHPARGAHARHRRHARPPSSRRRSCATCPGPAGRRRGGAHGLIRVGV